MPTTSTIASAHAATTPVTWVREPAASATGVRDELLESGKPWKSPVDEVGRAEREELLVLVDALPQLRRVAAREHARVGEGNERDCEGRQRQPSQVGGRDARHGEAGQALRQRAHYDHVVGQAQHRDEQRRPRHRDEHPGHLRSCSPQKENDGQASEADRERRRVGLVERARQLAHRLHEALGRERDAEQLRQLGGQHRQSDARQVAETDGLGDQVGEEAEAGDRAEREDGADEERQHRRRLHPVGDARPGERDDRRRHHRRHGRVWAQHEDARGPEEKVCEQGQHRRVQPRHGR